MGTKYTSVRVFGSVVGRFRCRGWKGVTQFCQYETGRERTELLAAADETIGCIAIFRMPCFEISAGYESTLQRRGAP